LPCLCYIPNTHALFHSFLAHLSVDRILTRNLTPHAAGGNDIGIRQADATLRGDALMAARASTPRHFHRSALASPASAASALFASDDVSAVNGLKDGSECRRRSNDSTTTMAPDDVGYLLFSLKKLEAAVKCYTDGQQRRQMLEDIDDLKSTVLSTRQKLRVIERMYRTLPMLRPTHVSRDGWKF
jgi:hypothetical protein